MAFNKIVEGLLYARDAGADLSGNIHYLAHVDTDGDIVLAGDGEHVLGVIYEAAVENKPVTVQFGGIAKVICGGAVTAGQRLASDSTGKAVNGTAAEYTFGTALTSGDSGDIIPVALLSGRAAA